MQVLITGGSGFLGRALAVELLARGYGVDTLDLSGRAPGGVRRHHQGNYDSPELLSQALEGVDVVCHMVGNSVPSMPLSHIKAELGRYLKGLGVLLETMVSSKIYRIVYPSSGGTIYGDGEGAPFKETDPLQPKSVYALGRMLAEETLRFFARVTPLEPVIARISNPYGNVQGANPRQGVIDNFAHRLASNQPIELWGDGLAVRDYIHIEDAVGALGSLMALESPAHDTYNIGSGRGTSLREIVEIFQYGNDNVEVIKRAPPAKLLDYSVLDVSRLRRELPDFQPRSIEEGIRDFLIRLKA